MIKINKIYKFVLLKVFILLIISLSFIKIYKFNYGIDFSSGISIECSGLLDVKKDALNEIAKKYKINFSFEESKNSFKVKFANNKNIKVESILEDLKLIKLSVMKINNISSALSTEIYIKAFKALIASFVAIFFYVLFSFGFYFASISVLSILINIIFLLGLIAFFQYELNFSIITALLIIIGYSINDTIILYDRIKTYVKNFNLLNKFDNINKSLSSVLRRSIITSTLTLISSMSLIFIQDIIITQFAIIVSIGIIIGTCFSIFFITSLLILVNINLSIFIKKEKTSDFYNS